MDRTAIQAEIERHDATKNFWTQVYRRFPLVHGHQELAQELLARYADKIGPMSIDEGIEYLGTQAVKEIERRKRRDVVNREAQAFDNSGPFVHGHSIARDGVTTLPPEEPEDHDPREMSLASAIRRNKEHRRNAQRRFNSNMRNFGDREVRR